MGGICCHVLNRGNGRTEIFRDADYHSGFINPTPAARSAPMSSAGVPVLRCVTHTMGHCGWPGRTRFCMASFSPIAAGPANSAAAAISQPNVPAQLPFTDQDLRRCSPRP